jgi:hypothetical protein
MGNSAVAVLHYDHMPLIRDQSERLANAMLSMPGSRQPIDFGVGRVVSWDHASGYQVVVVAKNTGWRVGIDEQPPPDDVLQACANALRAHGWSVKKPKI